MEQLKVAMIRLDKGLVLDCKCGGDPLTSVDTKAEVKCACGKEYTYNGWIIEREA